MSVNTKPQQHGRWTRLQDELITAVKPYTVKAGTPAAFFSEETSGGQDHRAARPFRMSVGISCAARTVTMIFGLTLDELSPITAARCLRLAVFVALALGWACAANAQQYPWERLPPTPVLPHPDRSGVATVNGIRLWYAAFGHGEPIILVHGGLANSEYWGLQVPVLARRYQVIVLDSRGHGRSTRTAAGIGYEAMASDVLALMDTLHIGKAAVVGWSDGAIVGLDIAIHHPERLTKLFAFAANSDPSGVKNVDKSPVFNAYIERASREYAKLSPTPTGFKAFLDTISRMWATEPHFTADQLRGIHVPTWIVDADHDEAIKRENTDHMASLIPGAGELILPGVSHFAFLQDPDLFNAALMDFLAR